MRRFALTLAAFVALCPVSSWAQDNGADAFAARDFAAAQQLWQQEAADGSADAMLGLGLIADRGYTGPRDFNTAFDWYSQAADLGLAEAQFNIAIMHDAGLGRDPDADQALVWYTRAALRGHARAQYNLGLLYETGDGVATNADLAAHWFEKAAQTVPAAAQKSLEADAAASFLSAPQLSFAQIDAQRAELVWKSAATESPNFLVEILGVPESQQDYATPLLSQLTIASGFMSNDVVTADNAVSRVSNITDDGSDYSASNWIGTNGATPPKGRITLMVDGRVDGMVNTATFFADDLRQAGYWVRIERNARAQFDDFYISYGFTTDQVAAETLANYMPTATNILPVNQVLNGTQPGEIIVNLAAFR